MSNKKITRREFGKISGAVVAGGVLVSCTGMGKGTDAGKMPGKADVVIVGGGFGGATCAKYLKKFNPGLSVVLIEANREYYTCPFSNLVLAGIKQKNDIRHTYEALSRNYGIIVVHETAEMIDIAKKTVKLSGGASVNYERAVVSPGIDFKYDALPGITESDTGMIPHAWKAGEQTWFLQNQLKAMPDGGTFLLVSPPDPFRCPPGPYERASMVAWYLKQNKPKSKIIILDQKDKFSKQALFMDGWAAEYGEMIEWRGKGAGGTISAIDVKNKTVETELGEEKGDVINYIPPQRAGKIAVQSGLANAAGWCPVNPLTFKSAQAKDIYVIGDAAVASEMPKSGFSANSQGKIVAAGIVRELAGKEPIPAKLANTCYSLIAPDYGISVAAVYEPNEKNVAAVKDTGGLSPKTADRSVRKQEAVYAEAWYQAITKDMFS